MSKFTLPLFVFCFLTAHNKLYAGQPCNLASPSITSGDTIFCFGDSTLLCVPAGFKSYLWGTGDTTACLTVKYPGEYFVTVTDTNNCNATSDTISISILPVPIDTIMADKTLFCAGDSVQICALDGYQSYSWNEGSSGSCTYARSTGDYYVTITDVNTCSVESIHISVTTYPVSAVSITQSGDTLSSLTEPSYQWYRNNEPLTGDTMQKYDASLPGSYTVAVTDTNGCVAVSNKITITGIQNVSGGEMVEIYPNPTTGLISLQTSGIFPQYISISDLNGKKISEQEFQRQMDVSDLAPGIYLMEIRCENLLVRKKMMKL